MNRPKVAAEIAVVTALALRASLLFAQDIPLNNGELNVFIDSTASYTIFVTALGSEFGSRND